MTRSTRALLLLLIMCWQALAVSSPWAADARAAEVEHMTLHDQSTGHHHHDDFSMHADNAGDENAQHQHADTGLQPPGLTPDAPLALPILRSSAPASRDEQAGPSPSLEGPKRPPKASS